MPMPDFSEHALAALREELRTGMSEKRYAHTLGVERTVAQMARIYCPHEEGRLRAAALLHDLTKEYSEAQTAAVLQREGIILRPDEQESPQVLHAITAPAEIRRLYPAFADGRLLSAVRWHTTGHAGMTVVEALLYLADVIKPGRTYPACIALREAFFAPDPARMTPEEREGHLQSVLLSSLTSVLQSLAARGRVACRDTLEAAEDLKMRKTL
jgi:nicotinate-nucleotide adenylyltransferase